MRTLIAVAHADDETLGCFSLLQAANQGADLWLLHATDSTPLHPRYAAKAGFNDVAAYRTARRAELSAALATVGLPENRLRVLPFADQDAPNHVAEIRAAALAYQADRIYTHAYEGGHPDHDALAFALHGLPNVWEFPLYRASPSGEFHTGGFLPLDGEPPSAPTPLADPSAKQRALACFTSQAAIIARFPLTQEWFRPQPAYDFAQPPHPGPLYYEIRQHGWTWSTWRAAVAQALPFPTRP